MAQIELGDKVKDSVSGFTGIATAKHDWLHGCTRFTVQPVVDKDKKLPEPQTFDEPQLVLISKRTIAFTPKTAPRTGGPRPATAEHSRNS